MQDTEDTNEAAGAPSRAEGANLTAVLAACPFCGGEAAHNTMRTSDRETIRLNGQDTFYGVNCIHCGTNNRGLLGYLTPDEATAHWNKRVAANG